MDRLRTFLMTDIQGSTRLWEEFPGVMPGVVKRHEEIIEEAVTRHSGELVKSRGEGDSTFSVFLDTHQAVQAALSAQFALLTEPWPIGVTLKVRMAVHAGEAEFRDGDYFGLTVNRCARIREIGHGGQVLVSGTAGALTKPLENENWQDLGVHRLRDQLRPERIWQVQRREGESNYPGLRSLSVLRNNLPIQLTSFIGRRGEVDRLKTLMHQHRFVNVIGFGGEGKTRLVLQVGAEIDDSLANGVWFVPLESLRTEQEVAAAILAVLGGEGEIELTGEVVRRLVPVDGVTWLILDNAEHLIPILQPIVDLLLRESTSIRILASSREPLGLRSEFTYRIPGMSVPPASDSSLMALENSEAGQLFWGRAVAHKSNFALTQANAAAIGDICRLVDGVPLAIEHASSLVGTHSPNQIREKLVARLESLESHDSTVSARHRSITAMISWSFELLDKQERELFLMLSLFRDTFAMEAATFMAQLIVGTESAASDLVRRLVQKSLVTAVDQDDSDVRFRLLETVRQFAHSQITVADERWMGRYVDWYIQFAEASDRELTGSNQAHWLAKCNEEHPNLMKALTWCRDHQDPRLLPLAFALRRYWLRRSMLYEGREWLEGASRFATESTVPALRTVFNVLGAFAGQQEEYGAALEYYDSSLKMALAAEDLLLQGKLFSNMAITVSNMGDGERALDYYYRTIELSKRTNDELTLLMALFNCAVTLRKFGRYDEATRHALEALKMAQAKLDFGRVALTLATLSGIAIEQHRYKDAAVHAKAALTIMVEQPTPYQFNDLLGRLSKLACLNLQFQTAMYFTGGVEALDVIHGVGIDPESVSIKQFVVDTVQAAEPIGLVMKWRQEGRNATHDQLVLAAQQFCDRMLDF